MGHSFCYDTYNNKKGVATMTNTNLQRGLRPEESTGNLRRYFDHLRRFERAESIIRLYGNHVYIFRDDTLVTVLALPNEYKADIQEIADGQNHLLAAAGGM